MQAIMRYFKPLSVRLGITLIYSVALFVVLVQPAAQPVIPTGIPQGPPSIPREIFFSSLHVLGFGLLTLLWFWTLQTQITQNQAMITAALIALIIGFVTEWLQTLVPDRGFQIVDLLANALGIGIAVWLIHRHLKRD